MQASNPTESPIVNNPIINNPILNSSIINSPIVNADEPEYADFSCGCSAAIPAGSRVFFMKMVLIVMTVAGGGLFGIYKLCEWAGWL